MKEKVSSLLLLAGTLISIILILLGIISHSSPKRPRRNEAVSIVKEGKVAHPALDPLLPVERPSRQELERRFANNFKSVSDVLLICGGEKCRITGRLNLMATSSQSDIKAMAGGFSDVFLAQNGYKPAGKLELQINDQGDSRFEQVVFND